MPTYTFVLSRYQCSEATVKRDLVGITAVADEAATILFAAESKPASDGKPISWNSIEVKDESGRCVLSVRQPSSMANLTMPNPVQEGADIRPRVLARVRGANEP